jgi:lipopolysaccharide export system permease protein
VAFLFAISYTLGMMYARGELVAVLGAGIGLRRLVAPFLVLGAALSVASFYFENGVVIPTYRMKNEAFAAAVRQTTSLSQSNVTVASPDQRLVYQADYYNDTQDRLTALTVVERGPDLVFRRRIDAAWGEWKTDHWVLHDCRVFRWDDAKGALVDEPAALVDDPTLSEPPDTFRRPTQSVTEMTWAEAEQYVALLRRASYPYREALTDLYRKLSFAVTPLVVSLIAASIGSTFRRNILLMSLLAALVLSVLFYVGQMVTAILSKNGVIPPMAGAWIPFGLFFLLGSMLFRTART